MSSTWTWSERKRRIRFVLAFCWLAYVLATFGVIAFVLPSWIIQNPFMVLVFTLVFLGPPAWINISWVYFPGYLFGSNGIRRLLINEVVQAQVSRNRNAHNEFGVPELPADLRTSASSAGVARLEPGSSGFVSTPVVWDQHLYVASSIVFPGKAVPSRTCPAALEFGAEALLLRAGRWRPGLVLELPYDEIIGEWNGSEIKTISSGSVLVVAVATERDEVLFPFEVARVKGAPSERATVETLVARVKQRRQ